MEEFIHTYWWLIMILGFLVSFVLRGSRDTTMTSGVKQKSPPEPEPPRKKTCPNCKGSFDVEKRGSFGDTNLCGLCAAKETFDSTQEEEKKNDKDKLNLDRTRILPSSGQIFITPPPKNKNEGEG